MEIQVGSIVSTLATNFDSRRGPKWSKATFPETWKTEVLEGTVLSSRGKKKWLVRWHFDDDEREVNESELALVRETASSTDDNDQAQSQDIVEKQASKQTISYIL